MSTSESLCIHSKMMQYWNAFNSQKQHTLSRHKAINSSGRKYQLGLNLSQSFGELKGAFKVEAIAIFAATEIRKEILENKEEACNTSHVWLSITRNSMFISNGNLQVGSFQVNTADRNNNTIQ